MTPRGASRPADAAVGRPSENELPAIACVMAEPLDSGPLNPTSSNVLATPTDNLFVGIRFEYLIPYNCFRSIDRVFKSGYPEERIFTISSASFNFP